MKVDGFFTLKDYFNYYISGFVWIINIFLLIDLVGSVKLSEIIIKIGCVSNQLGVVITGVLVLLAPYVIGFLFYSISQFVRRTIQGKERKYFHSPRKWIILRSEDQNLYHNKKKKIPYFYKKRLTRAETKTIVDLAEKRFSIRYKKDHNLLFNNIRTYLVEYGKELANFTDRIRDLMSFTESLLLSIPTLIALIFVSLVPGWWRLFGILWFFLLFWVLLERYYRLELEWVKRVYRSFLVIESKNNRVPND